MTDKPPTTSEGNAVQLGVIAEQIKNIEKTNVRIETSLDDLKKQIDSNFTPKSDFYSLDKRVGGIEDFNRWAVRLIIGAIIVAVLSWIGLQAKF